MNLISNGIVSALKALAFALEPAIDTRRSGRHRAITKRNFPTTGPAAISDRRHMNFL